MEVGGGGGGGVCVLLELGFEGGGAVVRGGFGCGGLPGLLRFVFELLLEALDLCGALSDLIGCGADLSLRLLKLRLEPSGSLAGTLCALGRCGACLFELGRELLSPVAVLGGLCG